MQHMMNGRARDRWIRDECWKDVLKKMPIPCVDVIVHRDREFLMGWRSIPPYKNVWALVGGRILRGESLRAAAVRHCLKSGLRISEVQFIGVYPVMFHSRHDITIGMAAVMRSGTLKPTQEMARYRWCMKDEVGRISPIGGNYKKMLEAWVRMPLTHSNRR
jgi:ADP-ribose pyrophosphatase YjhB (NUDIX family)